VLLYHKLSKAIYCFEPSSDGGTACCAGGSCLMIQCSRVPYCYFKPSCHSERQRRIYCVDVQDPSTPLRSAQDDSTGNGWGYYYIM